MTQRVRTLTCEGKSVYKGGVEGLDKRYLCELLGTLKMDDKETKSGLVVY
jgi:hypothetical protein